MKRTRKTKRDKKGLRSLKDRQVYIVGHQKAQNELLAAFLEIETGAQCHAVEDFGDVNSNGKRRNRVPKLALWDCIAKDPEGCLLVLESDCKRILAQEYLALFNVNPLFGIEEQAVDKGVRGFFYLQDPLEKFAKGVDAIFDGELWAPRKIMSECIMNSRDRGNAVRKGQVLLTEREIEILEMIAGGYSNPQIAEELCLSPHTVKTHLYNIFKKIKVPSRLQAALWAAKNL